MNNKINKPAILAPAGDKDSFLAAIAAKTDAVYCGLKKFSARTDIQNFSVEELSGLTKLAHDRGVKVFITLNSLIKPDELQEAGQLILSLEKSVKPDAIIAQDPAIPKLAAQAGFSGQIHISTLVNASFPAALKQIKKTLKAQAVVLPRELGIDQIKEFAAACPAGIDIEVFVHGALCYAVSGRCYWSSFLGGKSGLRGMCVQPCRRCYSAADKTARLFSCLDLSLDVLVKTLLPIERITAWKIEGRKKNPHYVYHTVTGYRILRDNAAEPEAKKEALAFLETALGRQTTHFNFLPQRPKNPTLSKDQTASGLLVGKVKLAGKKPFITLRQKLFQNDRLRVGYQDDTWHSTTKINRYIPKKGKLFLKTDALPASGTDVFLIDRRENYLSKLLSDLQSKIKQPKISENRFKLKLPLKTRKTIKTIHCNLHRNIPRNKKTTAAVWLSQNSVDQLFKTGASAIWWWLPPLIWADQQQKFEELIQNLRKKGANNFVLNSPWHLSLFKDKNANLWAGPFCNSANILALQYLKASGFKGAIVSPELGRSDYIHLIKETPIPLGIVISGNFPLCVSKIQPDIPRDVPFISPKKEEAWIAEYDSTFWIYPNWKIDLKSKKRELEAAGYSIFVNMTEPIPKQIKLKDRPGLWNWELGLENN